jgi:hypothetical protein
MSEPRVSIVHPSCHFVYTRMAEWPPLAWLARCHRASPGIEIAHGLMVETGDDWFCEAVWAGPFAAGDFDRTDLVFGSGARRRDGTIVFVSSGATVDRLHVLETSDGALVSNSLACLLAAAGGDVDPTHARYFQDFKSITRGLQRYERTLPTTAGPVRLLYYDHVTWSANVLRETPKPRPTRDFASFERYRDFLVASLREVADNMAATARRHPYRLLGTLSSGYDSPTVAALARPAGLRDVIAFDRARNGEGDAGREIAAALGLRLTVLPHQEWRAKASPEIPFVAADAKGEDVHFTAAEDHLAGRVLLTGFLGDEAWDRVPGLLHRDVARGELTRYDAGGLSLSEYRLWAGFIHCPVPFMGARQMRDIHRLTHAPAMAAWRLGGAYDRPICRRVLEEAGVPRRAVGQSKRMTAVLLFHRTTFLTPTSLPDFLGWLSARAPAWRERGWAPPTAAVRAPTLLQRAAGALARVLRWAAAPAPELLWDVRSLAERLRTAALRERLFAYVFPWALERAKARYRAAEPTGRSPAGRPDVTSL